MTMTTSAAISIGTSTSGTSLIDVTVHSGNQAACKMLRLTFHAVSPSMRMSVLSTSGRSVLPEGYAKLNGLLRRMGETYSLPELRYAKARNRSTGSSVEGKGTLCETMQRRFVEAATHQ